MTTTQEIKNQNTRRERRREAHRRINQIVYDAAEIQRIHNDDPVLVSAKAYEALRIALLTLESIKAGEE